MQKFKLKISYSKYLSNIYKELYRLNRRQDLSDFSRPRSEATTTVVGWSRGGAYDLLNDRGVIANEAAAPRSGRRAAVGAE